MLQREAGKFSNIFRINLVNIFTTIWQIFTIAILHLRSDH